MLDFAHFTCFTSTKVQILTRAALLLQFLLEFPMGDQRLHVHITSLVRNLDYGYESSRKVVLEVMARIALSSRRR